jgi:hypothetical protein
MPTSRSGLLIVVMALLCTLSLSSQEQQLTAVRVTAYEYRDYYGLPDEERWRKVESIRIVGQNRTGNIQAVQSGPGEVLEAVLYDVAVPSEYTITVTWQGGGNVYQRHSSKAQKETVHQIFQP